MTYKSLLLAFLHFRQATTGAIKPHRQAVIMQPVCGAYHNEWMILIDFYLNVKGLIFCNKK